MKKISIYETNNEHAPHRDVYIEGRQQITNLGTEPKFKTEAKLTRGNKSRVVQFVERHYDPEYKEDAETYVRNWHLLKEAGLPVPSVLRKTETGNLLVSDVSAGDKKVYGKAFDLLLRVSPSIAKESLTKEQVEIYKKVIDEHINEIEVQAKALGRLATSKGVLLPTDDPLELVVSPKGEWKIVILDLTKARKIDESRKENDAWMNEHNSNVFILWLKGIRRELE